MKKDTIIERWKTDDPDEDGESIRVYRRDTGERIDPPGEKEEEKKKVIKKLSRHFYEEPLVSWVEKHTPKDKKEKE
jgi:hypothetical protein